MEQRCLRSRREDSGCETWFSRASRISLSELDWLPGILSLILARHPLPPPPPPLLLLLSFRPGCHPPFAIPLNPDMLTW